MTTILDVFDSLAAGITSHLGGSVNPVIPDLQVDNEQNPNPTPPSIDMYPATDGFTEQVAFGPGNREYNITVRARVQTIDNPGGQRLLLLMMDDGTAESVEAALWTVSGVKRVVGPTGYGAFRDIGGQAEWLGTTWRVTFIP